jgi:hypothetical protein
VFRSRAAGGRQRWRKRRGRRSQQRDEVGHIGGWTDAAGQPNQRGGHSTTCCGWVESPGSRRVESRGGGLCGRPASIQPLGGALPRPSRPSTAWSGPKGTNKQPEHRPSTALPCLLLKGPPPITAPFMAKAALSHGRTLMQSDLGLPLSALDCSGPIIAREYSYFSPNSSMEHRLDEQSLDFFACKNG